MEQKEGGWIYCLAAFSETGRQAGCALSRLGQSLLFAEEEAAVRHPAGYRFDWVSRYVCPANAVAGPMETEPAQPVKYFRRMIYLDGQPIACEMNWTRELGCRQPLDMTLRAAAMRRVLERFLVEQCIRYRSMSQKHAQQLQIAPGELALCLESRVCDPKKEYPVQLSRLFVVPSRGYVTAIPL